MNINKFTRYRVSFICLLILIVVSAILVSKMTFMSRDLFDAASGVNAKQNVLKIYLLIFEIWLIDRVVQISKSVFQLYIIRNIRFDIKNGLFSSMMKKSLFSFITNDSGEYISILSNDINILEGRYYLNALGLISDLVSIVTLSTSFFLLQKTIALSIVTFIILAIVIPALFSKYTNDKNLFYSNKYGAFLQKVKEFILGFPTFKNYSVENKIVSKFIDENKIVEDAKLEAEYALIFTNQLGSFFSWFIQFVSVGVGLSLVLSGKTTLGTVVAAFSFASSLGSPLQTIVFRLNSIRSVKSLLAKLDSMLMPSNTISSSSDLLVEGDIKYENVTLLLGNNMIIDNFSFTFEKGKKYLIIGRNGSGKSSLMGLLNRTYNEFTGNIYIGNQNIKTLSNSQISKYISYLRENVSFLSDTIKNNITLYRDNTDFEIYNAINLAKIDIAIEREIGDEARGISSGEKRRIEIARSLLNSPDVLIFDEVVSTLDIETAYEIEELALSLINKTIIFISHNFSGKLLTKYDSILVMSEGKLIEQGNYSYLIKNNYYFRKICEIKGIAPLAC